MKNYRNRNDPFSMEDIFTFNADGTTTIDFINDHQWFPNDVSVNIRGGIKTVHRTFNVPEDGQLVGTVYHKDVAVQVFQMDKTRKIIPTEPPLNSDDVLLVTGQGYDTGIIVMEWNKEVSIHDIKLIMSYGYNIGDERNEMV